MQEKQGQEVKPSAEALAIVWATLGDWDVSSSAVEAVALILDRERRKARAEAFEEAARAATTAVNLSLSARAVAGRIQELAAKERAQ